MGPVLNLKVDVSVGDMDSSGVRKGHVDRLIQGALSRSPKADPCWGDGGCGLGSLGPN